MRPLSVSAWYVCVWVSITLPCFLVIDYALMVPGGVKSFVELVSRLVRIQAVDGKVSSGATCWTQCVPADIDKTVHLVLLISEPQTILQEPILVFCICDCDLGARVLFVSVCEDAFVDSGE